MGKLLFDEAPLVVDAVLATKIGLDAALVLQKVHYWLEVNRKKGSNCYDGCFWTYNSIKEWNKEFPFYTERTLQRIFKKLKESGILKAGNFNKAKFDKTAWYTIDYEKLTEIIECTEEEAETSRQNGNIDERKHVNDNDKLAERERQIGNTTATKCVNVDDKLATPIPKTSTKNSTETSSSSPCEGEDEDDLKSIKNVYQFFEENFYLLKKFDAEVIASWCKEYQCELIIHAMKIAKMNNAKALTYIERILINWHDEGIRNINALQNNSTPTGGKPNGSNKPSSATKCDGRNSTNEDDVSRALRGSGAAITIEDESYGV